MTVTLLNTTDVYSENRKITFIYILQNIKQLSSLCNSLQCALTVKRREVSCCHIRRLKLIAFIDLFSSCSVPTACLATI